MPKTFRIERSVTVLGVTSRQTVDVPGNGDASVEPDVPAAKVGQLTTRTDNTTGTLTMNAGHGIITGQKIDVYWVIANITYHRRQVVAGTVAGNSVPISGGTGDNLPANMTAVTVGIPVVVDLNVNGNNIQAAQYIAARDGVVILTTAGGTEIHGTLVGDKSGNLAGSAWDWYTGSSVANPFTGSAGAIAKASVSHSDSTATRKMKVVTLYN